MGTDIREQILDDIISRNVIRRNNPDQEYDAADLSIEMQLTRFDNNITGEYIVKDNIFDEIVAVIFLIIILLDAGHCDSKNIRIFRSVFIGALNEHGVIGCSADAERLIGVAVADEDVMRITQIQRHKLIGRADLGQVAARNNGCVLIHNADGGIHGIAHLVY